MSTIISTTLFAASASALSVTAASGSAADIQAAVDQVAAAGGGDVHIPAGTFNFFEPGETWETVEIPPGVNIFGAPTQRDVDGQVVEWNTVLVMPYEAPDESTWFEVELDDYDYDPTETNRFSDIRLVGYRFLNQSSTTMYNGIRLYMSRWTTYPTEGITDFRVDHCDFQDICGSALALGSFYADWNRRPISGVVDHCRFVNTYGSPGVGGTPEYLARTLGYGISMGRANSDFWEFDTSEVLGGYHNYTIFIEDNYFSKWRHCTASSAGIHYVFRHNIIEGDYGYGSVDAHGSYATESKPYSVGTRAIEVYNNVFRNPDTTWWDMPNVINLRGGSGIFYDNTLEGYDYLCRMWNDWGMPRVPFTRVNHTYIWNNDLGSGDLILWPSSEVLEDDHYFLREPSLAQDGWEYTPYPYPHPLTLEGTTTTTTTTSSTTTTTTTTIPQNQVTISGRLVDNSDQPVQTNVMIYQQGTDTIICSNQTDAQNDYELTVQPGTYDIQYNILKPDFYISNFSFKLLSISMNTSVQDLVKRITDYPTEHKISIVADIVPNQSLQIHSPTRPERILINGTLITEVPSLSNLTENTWFYNETQDRLHVN